MKVWGFAVVFLPILGIAQGTSSTQFFSGSTQAYFNQFISVDQDQLESTYAVEGLVEKLEQKRSSFKKEEDFLRFAFGKTHQKLLKNYKEYASFGALVAKGDYNCLTGTVMYALLLEHFGYSYQIVETKYHIFLLANLADRKVLLEATDPLFGFVSDEREMEKRINQYKRGSATTASSSAKNYYDFSVEVYNVVSLDKVQGLLYYNQAVNAYNQQQLGAAIDHLDKAIARYPSPRMEEFAEIILHAVSTSSFDPLVKEDYTKKIQRLLVRGYRVLASN